MQSRTCNKWSFLKHKKQILENCASNPIVATFSIFFSSQDHRSEVPGVTVGSKSLLVIFFLCEIHICYACFPIWKSPARWNRVHKVLPTKRQDRKCQKIGSNPNCYFDLLWKFQDFSVFQILREINFGESRNSKNAIFYHFRALNFADLVNISLQKVQKIINIKIQIL